MALRARIRATPRGRVTVPYLAVTCNCVVTHEIVFSMRLARVRRLRFGFAIPYRTILQQVRVYRTVLYGTRTLCDPARTEENLIVIE